MTLLSPNLYRTSIVSILYRVNVFLFSNLPSCLLSSLILPTYTFSVPFFPLFCSISLSTSFSISFFPMFLFISSFFLFNPFLTFPLFCDFFFLSYFCSLCLSLLCFLSFYFFLFDSLYISLFFFLSHSDLCRMVAVVGS